MVVVVFRSRIRPDADMAALERAGMRMVELASQMPGFVSYKDYSSADGESLTLVQFKDEPTLLAWRNHPEHLQVQQEARRDHFSEYHIQICKPIREYAFDREGGRRDIAAS
ncbi:MAG TPA: antibiotic biosynthesis monooxygenase [Burkholderiaceae bacterium]